MGAKKPAKASPKVVPVVTKATGASWGEPGAEVKARLETLLRRRGLSTDIQQGISVILGVENVPDGICDVLAVERQPLTEELWQVFAGRLER